MRRDTPSFYSSIIPVSPTSSYSFVMEGTRRPLRRGRGRRLSPVAGDLWRLDRHRLARSGGARWASQSGQDGGSSGGRWWRDCDSMVTLHLCMMMVKRSSRLRFTMGGSLLGMAISYHM
ncbi:hypothetical protein PVAP13_1NG514719 [Panicum virgatum]|uniref:Uncharacterized protein n=1 Tax=Panicum virgatum TaxID=38727 RepID=A0A8T0X622_PANVG|nr:hypothetical protein PVAP13_1NG514719 [Panicum virgatum]